MATEEELAKMPFLKACESRLENSENAPLIWGLLEKKLADASDTDRENSTVLATYLRHRKTITQALLSPDLNDLKQALLSFLHDEAFVQIETTTPWHSPMQTEEDARIFQRSDQFKISASERIHLAKEAVSVASPKILGEQKEQQTVFIKRLVDNYIKQSKNTQTLSEGEKNTTSQGVAKNLEQIIRESPQTSPEKAIDKAMAPLPIDEKIKKDIQTSVPILQYVENQQRPILEMAQTVATSPRPHLTTNHIVSLINNKEAPQSFQTVTHDAVNATRTVIAMDFSKNNPSVGEDVKRVASSGFFSAIAKTPFQKAAAPIFDAMNTLFPLEQRNRVFESIVGKLKIKLDAGTASLDNLTKTIGGAIVSQDQFSKAISSALSSAQAGTGPKTTTPVTGIRKVFDDLATAIFGKQLEETTITYVETTIVHKQLFSYQQLYLVPLSAQGGGPGFLQEIFRWGIGKGTDAAIQAGVKKATGKTVQEGIKAGVAAAASKTVGSAAATAGGGILAGPIGAALGWIGSKIITPILSFLGRTVVNFFSFGFFEKLFTGKQLTASDFVILGIIGVPILLFIFPSPLNFSQSYEGMKNSSLILGVGGGGSSLYGLKTPIIDCVQNPSNPLCTLTDCNSPSMQNGKMFPTSGRITQGPHEPGGTHQNLSAIDIAGNNGATVYAAVSGTVVSVNNVCQDGTGSVSNNCGGGYGNYVKIQTINGTTLIYGHLSQYSLSSISKGMTVSPTTAIGKVDDNGHSTGPHLHFGVYGSGSIENFLPYAIPSCSEGGCGYSVVACTQ